MTPKYTTVHTAINASNQHFISGSQPTQSSLSCSDTVRSVAAKLLCTTIALTVASALALPTVANAAIFTSSNATIVPANTAYASAAVAFPQLATTPAFMQSYDNLKPEHASVVLASEAMATPAAQQVLRQVRVMALDQRTILPGGCWDYLNAAFQRAGISRDTVFEGTYRAGPYADSEMLRSGDWLYYINHGYNDIEHSGLFIGWVDKPSRQALILSYAGESRHEPARYKVYDLSHVYQIMRPTA